MTTSILAQHTPGVDNSTHFNADTSRKRRKYRPGGPGGGGFWELVDIPQTEPPKPSSLRHRVRMHASNVPATVSRPRRERPSVEQPTYNSAADAVAATTQGDAYKPREERSWEEFHPDFDPDAKIAVFGADDVDGVPAQDSKEPTNLLQSLHHIEGGGEPHNAEAPYENWNAPMVNGLIATTPPKRRPGRPPRRPESMLSGLGSPPAQRITPLPTQNPRERLTLPKPSFREVHTFEAFEQDKANQVNFVNKTMESLGYQKNDSFVRPSENRLIRLVERAYDESKDGIRLESDSDNRTIAANKTLSQVEYDMDEQDQNWLDAYNIYRKEQEGVDAITPAVFEVTITQIEKEWHALEKRIPKPNPKPPQTHRPRSSSAAAVNGEAPAPGEEQDSKCAVCDDGDCENTNAIVFCDGCDLAVHQECYGVPYIPEGQWLCRKCQQIGRATPTCIFCPNTEGAFKMTTESKWAHLVCAIWIPEVTIGNMSFMEPVMQVADVPKSRWKLNCYICNQRMGACIQCGNRNCFQAFHVTCARRAKLFLKMKSTHGGPATLDASVLKAYCDKHVPPEWRNEHDVDVATMDAKAYYRREMRGKKWADSQQSALSMITTQHLHPVESVEEVQAQEQQGANATPGQKRKRLQAQKSIWRLTSGGPIVPQVVLNGVETALQRFNPPKRKEFVAEACKYWTLKREARRGAALLKRLQLQMETFSSTEITRRDFTAMGAAGGPKLQRRIDFAEQLDQEMSHLVELCKLTKEREAAKLADAGLLRNLVNTVYFPLSPLLVRVLEKAKSFDANLKVFQEPFRQIQAKLDNNAYTSVAAFSADLGSCFRSVVGLDSISDVLDAHNVLSTSSSRDNALSYNQKEILKLAKRIIKGVQQTLHDAIRSEAELAQKPFEQELKKLELLLDSSVRRTSADGFQIDQSEKLISGLKITDSSNVSERDAEQEDEIAVNGATVENIQDDGASDEQDSVESTGRIEEASSSKTSTLTGSRPLVLRDLPNTSNDDAQGEHDADDGTAQVDEDAEYTVNGDHPHSDIHLTHAGFSAGTDSIYSANGEDDLLAPLTYGGIPWYLAKFEPVGTTIQEEQYDGRERAMSAELSEMDEEELKGLGQDMGGSAKLDGSEIQDSAKKSTRKPVKRKRRRFR